MYKLRILPSVAALRSMVVSALTRGGATIYRVGGDATTAAEVRTEWPGGTSGLTATPTPLPEGWTLLG